MNVLMPVGEDLGLSSVVADERIVARHRTVIADPEDLPGVSVELLAASQVGTAAGAGRHEEAAIGSKRDSRVLPPCCFRPGVGDE